MQRPACIPLVIFVSLVFSTLRENFKTFGQIRRAQCSFASTAQKRQKISLTSRATMWFSKHCDYLSPGVYTPWPDNDQYEGSFFIIDMTFAVCTESSLSETGQGFDEVWRMKKYDEQDTESRERVSLRPWHLGFSSVKWKQWWCEGWPRNTAELEHGDKNHVYLTANVLCLMSERSGWNKNVCVCVYQKLRKGVFRNKAQIMKTFQSNSSPLWTPHSSVDG